MASHSLATTILRTSYRFSKEVGEVVGVLGGYNGLACEGIEGAELFKRNDPGNSFFANHMMPRATARYHNENFQHGREQRRICFDVSNGCSNMASFGSSSEKYANINVRVRSIQNLFESSGVEGSDILVVTLFEAQAKQWKRQLVLRLSNAAIEVATAGKAQGNKKKLAVADFTVANMVAPGCLGFLRRWNRPNIMLSRVHCVLICVLNVTLFRRGLP
ncbi:hypothetical protein ACMFMG_003615 [Clarireedia jacksonii]